MENKKFNLIEFAKKYWWAFAISFGICAILVLFLPVINYEIREALYDLATDERVSKSDYVYSMNLVSYFTTGFKLNYTMLITIGIIGCGILFAALSLIKKELRIVSGIIFLIAVCFFILSKEFFKADENAVMDYAKLVAEPYDDTKYYFYASLHDVSFSWGAILGIAFCTLAFATSTFQDLHHTTKQIAEEGVLIALAFVLNFIKIPVGATGGSINFQMLPLMLIALRHGPAHGFIASGVIYGLLTCLTDGYGFACYPFDYLIGFGSVAIMGLFRNLIFSKKYDTYNVPGELFILLAGILSTFVRYVGSNVSSMVVYGYTLKAALAYNAFYIPLSGLAAVVLVMAIYGPLYRINKRFPTQKEVEIASEEAE